MQPDKQSAQCSSFGNHNDKEGRAGGRGICSPMLHLPVNSNLFLDIFLEKP